MGKFLMIGEKDLSEYIFSNPLVLMILLFPFFKTSFFDLVPGLSLLGNLFLAVFSLLFFFLKLLANRFNGFSLAVLCLMAWMYIAAPLLGMHRPPSLFYLMGAVGIISFFELGFEINPDNVMDATCRMFALMVFINTVFVAFPIGFAVMDGVQIYPFGIRTGFSLVIIPGMMFTLLRDKTRGKVYPTTFVVIFAGVFCLVKEWVATGLVEIGVIVFLTVFLAVKKFRYNTDFVYVGTGVVILNLYMTLSGKYNALMLIISKVFNKDVTLSGRTHIWAKCVKRLQSSPLFGFGPDNLVNSYGMRPAHNQWLHYAMEGGYIAMFIAITMVLVAFTYLRKNKYKSWYPLCAIFMTAILVSTITEIQTYFPFFYIVYEMPYLMEKWDIKIDKNRNF